MKNKWIVYRIKEIGQRKEITNPILGTSTLVSYTYTRPEIYLAEDIALKHMPDELHVSDCHARYEIVSQEVIDE